MGSSYEVEVTITSAKDLKNINWRYGPLKPYAVVWVDPKSKSSIHVDHEGDTCPHWDETLRIPFNSPIEDSILHIDIVHAASAEEDTKPHIGSARLPFRDVVDEVGFGNHVERKLDLKRPSGRPHGKVEIKVNVHEVLYPPPHGAYPPPGWGVPTSTGSTSGPYGGYGAPYGARPSSYPYSGQASYGQEVYGQGYEEKKSSNKFGGMGTGLAVGAAAGLLGGLAIAEGADYVEDKIADDAADKVEEDLGYDDDDF